MSNVIINQFEGSNYTQIKPQSYYSDSSNYSKSCGDADTLDGYHANSFLKNGEIISGDALNCYIYSGTKVDFKCITYDYSLSSSTYGYIYYTTPYINSGTIVPNSIKGITGEKYSTTYSNNTKFYKCTVEVKVKESYMISEDGQTYSNLEVGDVCFCSKTQLKAGDVATVIVDESGYQSSQSRLFTFNNYSPSAFVYGVYRSSDYTYKLYLKQSTSSSQTYLPCGVIDAISTNLYYGTSKNQLTYSSYTWVTDNVYFIKQANIAEKLLS